MYISIAIYFFVNFKDNTCNNEKDWDKLTSKIKLYGFAILAGFIGT